jgi:hypothetical protein
VTLLLKAWVAFLVVFVVCASMVLLNRAFTEHVPVPQIDSPGVQTFRPAPVPVPVKLPLAGT